MIRVVFNIARFTVLEGWRGRTLWMAVGVVLVAWLVAQFSAGLAITDSLSYRSAIYAWLARPVLVLVLILAVAASVVREFSDRLLDLTWSRPVSRAVWFSGRLAGFVVLALVFALIAALPLLPYAAGPAVAVWGASLAMELALLACACLVAAVTLRQVTLAVTVTAAFYVLARTIDAIVLMSRGPTVDLSHWSTPVIAEIVAIIARVLPALDRFTDSAWLHQGVSADVLAPLAVDVLVFGALLIAVGLFDVYRLDD